jgi:hypothetical protein
MKTDRTQIDLAEHYNPLVMRAVLTAVMLARPHPRTTR